ncbi:hypothetical protein BOTBODRAFT_181217, partial [Botryobasidium botryosum FD-172 SS1]
RLPLHRRAAVEGPAELALRAATLHQDGRAETGRQEIYINPSLLITGPTTSSSSRSQDSRASTSTSTYAHARYREDSPATTSGYSASPIIGASPTSTAATNSQRASAAPENTVMDDGRNGQDIEGLVGYLKDFSELEVDDEASKN